MHIHSNICTCEKNSNILTQSDIRKIDPTRTVSLRNAFSHQMDIRFNKVIRLIKKAIIEQDCFGLNPVSKIATLQELPGYRAFAFTTSQEKVQEFMSWLKEQVDKGILTISEYRQLGQAVRQEWTDLYIEDSYKRGVIRARYEMIKVGWNIPTIEAAGGIAMVIANSPIHIDRCFVNGKTPIFTSKGWKPIGKIEIGDLVLTHKLRFRRVTKLMISPKQKPNTVTLALKYEGKSNYEKEKLTVTATEGHPFLVKGIWKNIEDLQIGDKVSYLATTCKGCGKKIPYWRTYCSKVCNGKDSAKTSGWNNENPKRQVADVLHSKNKKEAYANGTLDRFATTKAANIMTRKIAKDGGLYLQNLTKDQMKNMQDFAYKGKLDAINQGSFGFQNKDIRDKAIEIGGVVVNQRIKEGSWPINTPEVRKKAITNAKISVNKLVKEGKWANQNKENLEKCIVGIADYRRGLTEKFKRKGAGKTGIETKMENLLKEMEVEYIPEYNIGRYIVDFALPEWNIAIEADGDYWHKGKEEQDKIRQSIIEEKGWTMLRFSETVINKNIEEVRNELYRVLYNHSGQYEMMDLEISSIKNHFSKTPKTLYNFSVEEDESYVAKGFIVHNCGLLFTRTYNDLKGITDTMSSQISRVLAQGMADGDGARMIARKLIQTINGQGESLGITDTLGRFIPAQRRALMLARTEIIRAHHMGMIQEYRNWGVIGVQVLAEWKTAGDDKVCEFCSSMEGKTFTLDEIEPMIPAHPNCFIDPQTPIYTSKGWKPIGKIEIGDLVLTHKKRFRKVYALPRSKGLAGQDVVTFYFRGDQKVTMTANHLVLVSNSGTFSSWIEARRVTKKDHIMFLANECARCGKLTPYFKKYCTRTCLSLDNTDSQRLDPKHKEIVSKKATEQLNREYAFGIRNGKDITKKANDKTREMVVKGEHPFQRPDNHAKSELFNNLPHHIKASSDRMKKRNPMKDPEIVKKVQETLRISYLINPEKRINVRMAKFRKSGNMTWIEQRMAELLDRMGIEYISQYPILLYNVDFAIPALRIVIECDGEQWHQDKEKDKIRQERIEQEGWFVLRYTGTKINQCLEDIGTELIRVFANHTGDYQTMGLPIKEIKKWKLVNNRPLYNLSVEEDESYIAKGVVVHNCRCLALPLLID